MIKGDNMKKIKVSQETVLAIMQGIMSDKDINYTLTDTTAPQEWQGNTRHIKCILLYI